MSDLISRQAALDCFHDWIDRHGDVHTPDEMAEYRAIEGLPSAQPQSTNDCISRQQAIEVIEAVFPVDPMKSEYAQGIACGAALAKTYVEQLPSAQPETHEERTETHVCDLISRQAAIDEIRKCRFVVDAIEKIRGLPPAQPEIANQTEESAQNVPNGELISKKAAIEALEKMSANYGKIGRREWHPHIEECKAELSMLPFAQPKQKYTNKELRVFMHGISMRLLSLRSAQHWKHDDETAEEIKFLERLYKKVESEVTQ